MNPTPNNGEKNPVKKDIITVTLLRSVRESLWGTMLVEEDEARKEEEKSEDTETKKNGNGNGANGNGNGNGGSDGEL